MKIVRLKRSYKTLINLLLFIFLTVITQIGGLVYLFSIVFYKRLGNRLKVPILGWFMVVYLLCTYVIVPIIAPLFGREPIKNSELIEPSNYLTIFLNRNYVEPAMNLVLENTSNELLGTGIKVHYLDANFPFLNKFPLFPHLSHNDGKKLDISFIYENEIGKIENEEKSLSGYGVFEAPRTNEYDQIDNCISKGFFQYDLTKYLSFGSTNENLLFSVKGTKALLLSLLKNEEVEKIFIEPHLKLRLKLIDTRIRYQGCRAVRHDDHIHLQIK